MDAIMNNELKNEIDYTEKGMAPLFISLDIDAPLPSADYVRVVALSGARDSGNINNPPSGSQNSTRSSGINRINGNTTFSSSFVPVSTNSRNRNNSTSNNNINNSGGVASRTSLTQGKETVKRHDFALHTRGARMCRLLETILDTADLQLGSNNHDIINNENKTDRRGGKNEICTLPPVVLPQATRKGCEALFLYLDMITTRVPTILSKPLRAPIEELVQPWELNFLLNDCMDEKTSRAISQEISSSQGNGKKNNAINMDTKVDYYRIILNGAPQSMDLLLEVAMLSDFLLVESLRQLTCAFIASLGLTVNSEAELLKLCGLQRAMTEEELEPLYAQFPFLRPDNSSDW